MSAKIRIAWTFLLFTIAIILQCKTVQSTYQLEYMITIHTDGSAYWIIEQKGIGIPPSFETFCQKVNLILQEAEVETFRSMNAHDLSMMANLSGSYSIIKYMFRWENFSVVEGSIIKIGDVFEVENFFEYLYGNGLVRIEYPSEYTVESISPNPHEQDASLFMLEWYGIEDFKTGEPKIVLREKSSPSGILEIISKDWILIIIVTTLLVSGVSAGIYFMKVKKRVEKLMESKSLEAQLPLRVADDEKKVVNLLRAAGGSMYQSVIAEKCEFSRAKASKLLKVMENKGIVKRENKGREKMVTLLKESKK